MGYLSRMTQWKVCQDGSKISRNHLSILTDHLQSKLALSDEASALEATSAKAKPRLGLFSYPVLQAADILLYGYGFSPWSGFSSLTLLALLMFR